MRNQRSKIKNVFTVSALALVLVALGSILWVGLKEVKAATAKQPVVDKLVERFNLNEDEVTGVFDELHQERMQKMQANMEAGFNEAVEDGVITAEQKQALLDKKTEMQEKHQQLKEEMKIWMEDSGINFEALAPYKVGCGGRGFGKGYRFGGY